MTAEAVGRGPTVKDLTITIIALCGAAVILGVKWLMLRVLTRGPYLRIKQTVFFTLLFVLTTAGAIALPDTKLRLGLAAIAIILLWAILGTALRWPGFRDAGEPSSVDVILGEKVRVRTTPLTQQIGCAGSLGFIDGVVRPSTCTVHVIGESSKDVALSVLIEDGLDQYWFAPELLEFVSRPHVTLLEVLADPIHWHPPGGWTHHIH
jgi:hypothetical protein